MAALSPLGSPQRSTAPPWNVASPHHLTPILEAFLTSLVTGVCQVGAGKRHPLSPPLPPPRPPNSWLGFLLRLGVNTYSYADFETIQPLITHHISKLFLPLLRICAKIVELSQERVFFNLFLVVSHDSIRGCVRRSVRWSVRPPVMLLSRQTTYFVYTNLLH